MRNSVFDPEAASVGALRFTYRTLNVLHVRTRESFVRRELLFDEGDCLDPFLLEESERILDLYDFLARVTVEREDDGAGGHRVRVTTWDEWSTQFDLGVTYDDGLNLERVQMTEENFLGRGMYAEVTHNQRREVRRQAVRLATPRFLGRADASIAVGRDRPGRLFSEYVRYPFVGEVSRTSFRHGYSRQTTFFSYGTEGQEEFDQLLVPTLRETLEFGFARRLGEPGRSWIVGVSVERDVLGFPQEPQVTSDFDVLEPWEGPLPEAMSRQLVASASTRVGLHLGTRRFTYERYEGLDGIREGQLVAHGLFAGVTLGRGFAAFVPAGSVGLSDVYGRAHLSYGLPVGTSLFHGAVTVEGRREDGDFRDGLLDADMVAYLRNDDMPGHTLFVRASGSAGWSTHLPFQLSLGGREGVRSLAEDRYPGGRMTRFLVEDRIALPWPPPGSADLGLTVFADLGRVWAGDAPYGVDSGWQAGVGFGVRLGVPPGTRNVWRADIVFPVGRTNGSPVFRVVYELNRLRSGFFTRDVFRSRRLDLGPDHF